MVKSHKRNTTKKTISKEDYKNPEEARKISASTHYETCSEQLSPFGGLTTSIVWLAIPAIWPLFSEAYINLGCLNRVVITVIITPCIFLFTLVLLQRSFVSILEIIGLVKMFLSR